MALSTLTSRVEEDNALVEDPFYSKSNQVHLMKSMQQLRDGKGTAHGLIEDDDE